MNPVDLTNFLPIIVLTVWAAVLLLVDLFIPKERKGLTALLAAVGLALTIGLTLLQVGQEGFGFNGMVVFDGFSTFVNVLLLVSGMVGISLA